jgi:hypothetical protein
VAERLASDLGQRACQFDTGGAAAHEHEREQLLLARRVRFPLRLLEGEQ